MKKSFLLLWLVLLPLAMWAASADLVTKPTLRGGLVYNDAEQALMEGTATFPTNYSTTQGGVRYFVTNAATPTPTYDASTWSSTFPTETNAGTYYVWYIVLRDGVNYTDNSPVQSLGSVIIARRNITAADFTCTAQDLTYTNAGNQALVSQLQWNGSTERGDQIRYSKDGSNWYRYNENGWRGTNAGDYTVSIRIRPNSNHLVNGSTTAGIVTTIPVTIAQATTVVTAPTPRAAQTYDGNFWRMLDNAGSTNFGTLQIRGGTRPSYTGWLNSSSNWNQIAVNEPGTYTIEWQVIGNANYTSKSGTVQFTLNKAVPTFNASSGALATGLVYKGNSVAQQLVTTAYTCTTGGNVRYHIAKDGGAIGSAINGITNVTAIQPGTYDIYYSIVSSNTSRYEATPVSDATKIGTVVIAKAELAASATSAEKEYDGTAFNDPSAFYSVGSSPKFLNGETATQQAAILAKLFTVTGYDKTNAGTYDVNVKSKEADDVPYTISPMIEENTKLQIKKTNKNVWTTAPGLSSTAWYYGSTPATPVGAAKFVATGEPTFKYYDNSKTEMSAPTATTSANASGEHYYMKAFVEETDNYNGLESDYIEFTINPADPAWATTPAMAGWEYTKYSVETNTPAGAVGYSTTYTYKYFQNDGTTEIPAANLPTLGVGNYYAQVIAAATNDYVEKTSALIGFQVTPTKLPTIAFKFDAVPYINKTPNNQMPTLASVQAKITEVTSADYDVSYTDKDGNAVTEFVDAGTYYVVITGKGNYAKLVDGKTNFQKKAFVIEPIAIAAEDIVAKANNLTYDNTDQALVKPAEFKDGIKKGDFLYAVVAKDAAAPTTFKSDIPTGFNAGEYDVYVTVDPDANHSDVPVVKVETKILPVTIGYMLSNVEKTWTGAPCTDEEVEEAYSLFVGELQGDDFYNPPFTLSLPVTEEKNFIDAGTYTFKKMNVEWNKDKEGNEVVHNYKINWSGNGEVLINKAKIETTDFTAPEAATLTYNTQAQNLVKEGYKVTTKYPTVDGEPIGTIVFSTEKEGTYSTTVPQATNVSEFDADGKKSVWFKVVGDDNHKDTDPVELTATMGAKTWNPVLAFVNIPNEDVDGVYGQDYMPTDLSVKDKVVNGDEETLIDLVEVKDGVGDYTLAITKNGEAYTGDKLVDVGTYVFTYTAQGNYEGSVDRTIQILPATFEAPTIAAVDYNGKPQEPDYSIEGLTEGDDKDYTVAIVSDDATWTNAGEYVINYTGIGNYAGTSVSATYKIKKLEVIAEAADASKVYDGVDGIGDTEVAITYNGLLTGEAEDAIVPGAGAIKAVDKDGNESAKAGIYTIVLDPEKFVSTNYTVLAGDKKAQFEITPATLAVMWNDEYVIPEGQFTKVYGAAEPTLTATADNVKLVPTDKEYEVPAADVAKIIAATVIKRADLDKEDVGTYDVELAGKEDAAILNNYDVQFFSGEGVFTITPATLKVSLAAQTKVYDGKPAEVTITTEDLSVAGLIGDDTKDVIDVTKLTATVGDGAAEMAGEYQINLALADEEDPAAKNYKLSFLPAIFTISPKVTIADQQVKATLALDDVDQTFDATALTVEGVADGDEAAFAVTVNDKYMKDGKVNAALGSYEDGLVIVAVGAAAAKYVGWEDATGKLLVVPANPIILSDAEPFVNDEVKTGVTVTFTDRAISPDKNGEDAWTVLTLPFATTPAKISDAFGFAAVDVLDKTKGADGDVHFKLITSGTIAAGTPFLVKPTSDDEAGAKKNFNEVVFEDVTIEIFDGENTDTEVDAGGNIFYGVFKNTSVFGEQYRYVSKGAWYNASKYTSEKPLTLKPFRAYLEMKNAAARIFVEEVDGTITAINGISFNNNEANAEGWYTVSGMKLNAAPTQKGTYINNGKKVIVK